MSMIQLGLLIALGLTIVVVVLSAALTWGLL